MRLKTAIAADKAGCREDRGRKRLIPGQAGRQRRASGRGFKVGDPADRVVVESDCLDLRQELQLCAKTSWLSPALQTLTQAMT